MYLVGINIYGSWSVLSARPAKGW